MKYFWILSLIALVGCTGEEEIVEPNEFDTEVEKGDPYAGLSMKDAVELHIRRELSIPADQPLDYKIYQENCDGDDSLDAVITVNLLDRAIDKAIESGKVANMAQIGYMGNFNYFIYRDGFSGKFSPGMVVASSPKAALKIDFEPIRSEKQNDILITYRVLNAAYCNYYSISNGRPIQMNQVKLFDELGKKDAMAFVVEYEKGKISDAKDIVLYTGTFTNPTFTSSEEVYTHDLDVTKTPKIHERWFFNPQDRMYYLDKSK